jgi:hypothetical protein
MPPAIIYECETWFLTLREGHRLRVFVYRVLWMIFRSKMVEVTGDWTRHYNEEPRDLYSATNTIWMIKSRTVGWVWQVAHIGGNKRRIRGFGGVTEGHESLRIIRCRKRIILKFIFIVAPCILT